MPRNADLLPDWFVGGAGKRRLLTALTNTDSPLWEQGPPWTDIELASGSGLSKKNAIGRHLQVLERAELLLAVPGGWERSDNALWAVIESYLDALKALPETSLPPSRGGFSPGA